MKLKQILVEETRHEYLTRLTGTLKIKRLGKGAFASVFQHPVYSNVAVKYVDPDEDYAYMYFIRECMKKQHNRFLPKVIGINYVKMDRSQYADRSERGALIFFQKLRPAKVSEIKRAVSEMMDTLPNDNPIRQDHSSTFEEFSSYEWEELAKHSSDRDIREVAKMMLKMKANDIHNGNVMMRDEGNKSQLVFTDPVAT